MRLMALNARPGLAIQKANVIGMQTRFDAGDPEVEKMHSNMVCSFFSSTPMVVKTFE